MKILVTGAAGFIGMHTALRFLKRGDEVIGVDNLNSYYDVNLKKARLAKLNDYENFSFYKINIADRTQVQKLFESERPVKVIHLAAQAGVRYSIVNPYEYIDSNIQGFINILEGCRNKNIAHLVYASSSSVYGGNTSLPFSENQNVDHPCSLYAATKKSNELMAHSYSHLFELPTTGLRFFTVYGPWGRPDMALFKFIKAIFEKSPIEIFNHGKMIRDFTFVDDIVEGVVRVTDKLASINNEFNPKNPSPSTSNNPFRIFNIGNNQPISLLDYIDTLEKTLGIEAKKIYLPMQPGDVPETTADTQALYNWINFKPNTSIEVGIKSFVEWYLEYYNLKKIR